ncbi:hypothetical protein EDD18DRAFT_1146530 [Armillaria luteobubalina]|uniref:Uncharacterized protein n=1 Tax=Armillaria luteobubalina TaxID=153913 RepID=A0AA39V0S1_9AGAR|nr:hypothetical protein EDD18DRAFT_1146530 [Armillaria luteobubalina]
MLPHFGEYVAFKLDPVASLTALNDPEVTKVCEALENKTYVFCVTYLLSFPLPGVEYISVSMTLLSKGLPSADPERFITSDMSVPVLPNSSSSCSPLRPPLGPLLPLPWPDCYHPTQARTRCRVRNDVTIDGEWPEPKYRFHSHDQILLDRKYYNADSNRREVLKRGQEPPQVSTDADVTDHQSDECKTPVTLPPSEHETSQHCRSISECSHPCEAESERFDNACEVESQHSRSAGDAGTEYSHSISQASQSHAPKTTSSAASFLRSLFSKLLPCLPCLRADFHNDDDVASISPSDPIWSHPIFGARPPDTLPVMVVLDNLESIEVEQINDPWDFFKEIDTLKRIEDDFKERMKAKTQAAIERARQKDEALYVRLQSKMPKRVPASEDTGIHHTSSDPDTQKS